MVFVERYSIPSDTLLHHYLIEGAYTDCYITEVPGQITLPEFIFAFYTTSLFKLERFVLRWSVSKPSTDLQAGQLSQGNIETFAAWQVESRKENEILLCDFLGRTRSWFMVVPVEGIRTRLYFGSAVVPERNPKTGRSSLGFPYQALLGFHRVYSRLLLFFAGLRIRKMKK